MRTSPRLVLLTALVVALAGCATPPPPEPAYPAAPPKKCVDAKTQLETGRRC